MIKNRFLWILIPVLVLLDQWSKFWAIRVLKPGKVIPIIKNVLELTYVENRGAAFGILQNRQIFFLLITLAVLAGILLVMQRMPDNKRYLPLSLCLVFVASGAVGNMIDRMVRHYVVDFIYFKPIDFPVFNVADIYVTISAGLLILLFFFYYKEEELEQVIPGKKR